MYISTPNNTSEKIELISSFNLDILKDKKIQSLSDIAIENLCQFACHLGELISSIKQCEEFKSKPTAKIWSQSELRFISNEENLKRLEESYKLKYSYEKKISDIFVGRPDLIL